MFVQLLGAPLLLPEPPTWADKLEAWSTLGGAVVALAAAVATISLLVHQIRETNRARADARQERTDAAADRELARQDRELVVAERRDAAKAQARTVVIGDVQVAAEYFGTGYRARRILVPISNFGKGPVLDLRVYLDTKAKRFSDLPRVIAETGALGPGETVKLDYVVNIEAIWGDTEDEAVASVVLWMSFTDAMGVQWTRRMSEQPEQVLD